MAGVLRAPAEEAQLDQRNSPRTALGVAATLCILDSGVGDDQITGIIEQIDEVLLPEASRAEGNLHFTVVRGQAIGDFVPHAPSD
jgi:hypothetical protein